MTSLGTWVYFFSEKSVTLATFKEFKALTEKECEEQICFHRIDMGGELTSGSFNGYCESSGIKRQLTAVNTP